MIDAAQKKEDTIDTILKNIVFKILLRTKGDETEKHSIRTLQDMMLMTKLYFESHLDDEEVQVIMKDPNYLKSIERGALLHDIGKMGVPDTIVNKPGELTPEERTIMEKHTTYAKAILGDSPELTFALDIPYSHHEKLDGTGYPQGLKGKEIPLVARMFTVVDVWEALTSDRSYRKAWEMDVALKYINDLSGTSFDPEVVQVFNRMYEEQLLSINNAPVKAKDHAK